MPKRKSSRSRKPSTGGRHSNRSSSQPGERLQKILAAAGVASRRDCEQLIVEGRVMVDGKIVTKLGSRADLATQEIVVDGQKLKRPKHVYYAVHKPKGVLSTNWDPSGRMRLIDLAPDDKRLFCVGRLDRSSEGLAMLTNDGDLAHRIMHPSFGMSKTYVVEVAGSMTSKNVDDLQKGVFLSEGKARASKVRVKSRRSKSTLLEIELKEGKNREIRRIMAKLDHKVLNLKRIAIGPLRLGDMPPGAYRALLPRELSALRKVSLEGAEEATDTTNKRPTKGKPPASSPPPPLRYDDDFDDDDYSDELVEVREFAPQPRGQAGAVIGGEAPARPKRKRVGERGEERGEKRKRKTSKKAAGGGKGKPSRGAAAKKKTSRKGAKKPAGGGKSKRKGGR